jgi:hypothetical protein
MISKPKFLYLPYKELLSFQVENKQFDDCKWLWVYSWVSGTGSAKKKKTFWQNLIGYTKNSIFF